MKKAGEWMDPDFNKRDSFHVTIKHPKMTAEEWTQAYENAWVRFYSKENMIRILSRWSHNPGVYWNLMSIFFWYKNAALIEKEHPMVAGFFRLKERTSRRPGFAIDPLRVHLWKRSKEVFQLFLSWGHFLKEMEEIWLQTRKKSKKEERWLEEIQRIQGEIWQALKISEWQKVCSNARATLPARAMALLDPFEELSSKILFTRKDLNRFLKQWEGLQTRIHDLRRSLALEEDAVHRWLDDVGQLHKSIRIGSRIQEWQEAYSRLRHGLPSKMRLPHVRFDAFSNRAFYSRQDLNRFWSSTVSHLQRKRFWNIRPGRLVAALLKDFFLTASFAFTFRAHSRPG